MDRPGNICTSAKVVVFGNINVDRLQNAETVAQHEKAMNTPYKSNYIIFT